MKKLSMIVFAAALTAVFAGGCATSEAEKKAAAVQSVAPDPCVPAEREAEAKAAAEKIALGMAEALRTGDFEKFRVTQQEGARMMPPELFAKVRKSMMRNFGNLTGSEYIGFLDQGRVRDYMWKFVFEAPRKDSPVPRHHEIIYWVRVGFANGAPVVYGYRFDLH